MAVNSKSLANLKSFKKGDPRICRNSSGRPKGSRQLKNVIRDMLALNPEVLLDDRNPKTFALIQNFKKYRIKDLKDLLGLRIVIKALQGDKHAIDLVISQLGEDKPIKADVNTRLTKINDLTDEQLETITVGDATFGDFFLRTQLHKQNCKISAYPAII